MTAPTDLPSLPLQGIGRSRKRLMVGGPTHLPPTVAAAGALPVIDERTAEFAEVFVRVTDGLRTILRTTNDVLTLTSSTTGAQESVVQNVCAPGDRVLVASNGFYGERWIEMALAFGLDVVAVTSAWGSPLDLDRVAATIAADRTIRTAFAVQGETSTGMVNDVAGFAAAAADRVCVVDAASTVGACELRTDAWGVDVVVAAPQKALMAPPGLAFVSVSPRAWAAAARSTMPRFYFDWELTHRAYQEGARTAFTPAVGLIGQLDRAIGLVLDEGLDACHRRHSLLGRLARIGCAAMGLATVAPEDSASPTLTAARMPADVAARHVVEAVAYDHGVQLAAGSGEQVDQVVRIGHCGDADVHDVATAVNALELTLWRLGAVPEAGPAAQAMQRALAGHDRWAGA